RRSFIYVGLPLPVPLISCVPPLPPRSTLLPYTTLFRSEGGKGWARRPPRDFLGGGRDDRVRVEPGRHHDGLCELEPARSAGRGRSEEHTSELQSRFDLVCRLLLEKK